MRLISQDKTKDFLYENMNLETLGDNEIIAFELDEEGWYSMYHGDNPKDVLKQVRKSYMNDDKYFYF